MPTPDPVEWTVSVDPLTWALSFAHLQVEHTLGPHASLYLSPSLHLYDGLIAANGGPYQGYGVESGFRWFFTGTAPRGGWLMARGTLAYVTTAHGPPDADTRASALGGYTSGLVGYTGIIAPGLVLSGGIGVSYFDYGVAEYGIHGVLPAAHTAIGWAF